MTNTNNRRTVWLALLATLLLAFTPKAQAQEADDLQDYLDQIAAGQQAQPVKKSPRRAESVEIPVGLTEVDLSKFTSYQNRTKQLTIKASVKFTNGTITAAANYSGGGSLLKVYGGATVVLDATAGVSAGSTTTSNCLAAVGIYEGSTFYQCGDITAPDNGTGIAVYIDDAASTYNYVSGTTKGTISNEKHGTVVGVDEDYQFKDGETFTAPTVENVTMTFQVISASEKTCRVGIGSAAAIATSTQGVVTIPGKVKGLTVTTISNRAFKDCQALTRVVIPGTVTTIGTTDFDAAMGAFHGCLSITSFDIPSSVTLIGRGTFSGCVSVTSFTLPSSVTTLGSCAFDGCSGLKSVELSPNIKSIEMQTFRYCSSLQSIVIPAAITSFGGSAFTGCNNLTSITSLVTTPFSFGSEVFSNYNARLYVPAGTKAAYQATACWNRFAHIYTIGSNEEQEDLQAQLAAIGQQLDRLSSDLDEATMTAATVKATLGNSELTASVDATLAQLRQSLASLRSTYNALVTKVNNAQASELATLQSQVDELQQQVSASNNSLQTMLEDAKATVVNLVQTGLSTTTADLTALQAAIVANSERVAYIESQTGTGFFMRQSTEAFTAQLGQVKTAVNTDAQQASALVGTFNSTFNGATVSTVEQALELYTKYQAIVDDIASLKTQVAATTTTVSTLGEAFDALPVVFPDEDVAWSLRPSGLKDELQAGYKSNRGFVLTSAGQMFFEQVSGTTFRLRDADDHYLVATSGTATLRTGTKAEATVWSGQNLGNGSYTFHSDKAQAYLSYGGIQVNSAVQTSTAAHGWTIEEGIDELQAFLNLLAEEEEESGGDLLATDTLFVVVPTVPPGGQAPTTPFVFPKVNYPVVVTGGDDRFWHIPAPKPGQPRPADFHPIDIPKGSHVIIDDVTFRDLVGGDHVIYVEGIVEVMVNVVIDISDWEWLVRVGPGGRVIWHPGHPGTGAWPHIYNEGTLDVTEGGLGRVDNHGTVNHTTGTVQEVVNRNVYHFVGGIVNLMDNYGTMTHDNGQVITACNYENATYTMTGGRIENTNAGSSTIVFRNYGVFRFLGGVIGGWGSHLIWHGPGATLRIDGGTFDFSHVTKYFIEAHDHFYIRGDYDYKATVPILLDQKVTIKVLYNWVYRFNVVFVDNGRPLARFPLFFGEGFNLTRQMYAFINWTLPNKRWRWHFDATANTIEPRDEEVMDDDDLQAYIDWLAANQADESASTAEKLQPLDLKGREILLLHHVSIPVGSHVRIANGTFKPKGTWSADDLFHIPAGASATFQDVTIDFSSASHYLSGGSYVQRRIFNVYGIMHFGAGCHVKGYYAPSWHPTDTYLPGAVIYLDPSARFYLDGGRLDQVVLRVNTVVNIYVTAALLGSFYAYLPEACRYEGYRLMATADGLRLSLADLRHVTLLGTTQWGVEYLRTGYAALFDKKWMGDVNGDKQFTVSDVVSTISSVLSKPTADFREALGDVSDDGEITVSDVDSIINIVLQQSAKTAE